MWQRNGRARGATGGAGGSSGVLWDDLGASTVVSEVLAVVQELGGRLSSLLSTTLMWLMDAVRASLAVTWQAMGAVGGR